MTNRFVSIMKKIKLLLLCLPVISAAQQKSPWANLSKEDWPIIALTNHVQYENGDTYVHSSFPYAGTGFLIEYKGQTFAATAKHILMVAPNKKSGGVEINAALKSWVLNTKPFSQDSVVVDQLINEDKTEILMGAKSSIMERDWLVFSTKYASENIQALKPRFTEVKKGEKVYLLECAYEDENCTISEGKVFRKEGMDILIERIGSKNKGGGSGSPVIDKDGLLIGIESSSSTASGTMKNVLVAVSTAYLKNVFDQKADLNLPKIDYGAVLFETAKESGNKAAIAQYKNLTKDKANYYTYNLRDANRNGLRETGEKLMSLGRTKDAIALLKLNVKNQPGFFRNYNLLAEAYFELGKTNKATKYYEKSTKLYANEKENPAFEKILNLK